MLLTAFALVVFAWKHFGGPQGARYELCRYSFAYSCCCIGGISNRLLSSSKEPDQGCSGYRTDSGALCRSWRTGVFENGDVPISFADGGPFGPHACEIGVPGASIHRMGRGLRRDRHRDDLHFPRSQRQRHPHELAIAPAGDVPPFFTWPAFHAGIHEHYQACE